MTLRQYLINNPTLLYGNYSETGKKFDVSYEQVRGLARKLRKEVPSPKSEVSVTGIKPSEIEEFLKWKSLKDSPTTIKASKRKLPSPFLTGDPDNVLVIGDLHAPFILDGYLEFCRNLQEKYNCGTVVFIGDMIDGNSWSYHEHDVDGMSVKEEVAKATQQLEEWYKVFPTNVYCLYGNHDLLVARKAKTAGLSQLFIRDFNSIIGAPAEWKFLHEFEFNNVKYIHGTVGNAIKRAKDERVSICQGHLHSQAFIEWAVSEKDALFGFQVGCGIDRDKYAFEYAKPFPKKPVISAGVILEKGSLPILELMKL